MIKYDDLIWSWCPESTDFNEFGDKVTGDVESDERLQATYAGTSDEGGRGGSIIGGWESGDLMVIQLDDGGMDTDGGKEISHDVAHAARGTSEDDDGMLRYQTLDSCLSGFIKVHR